MPIWPDRALDWTTDATGPGYQINHIYLLEPFMNNQVAWDSEYYLAISIGGYDDPNIPAITKYGVVIPKLDKRVPTKVGPGLRMSLSYAFLPFYPLLIRLLTIPLHLLGMNPIATATLAGIIISALGTLAGMLALYDLTHETLGEAGGYRAAFYLIIFPSSFFLAQIYTEGLFVGLTFCCLAMLKRGQWWPAAILGAAATLTRAVGVTLIIPMSIAWFQTRAWTELDLEWRQIYHQGLPWRAIGSALLAFTPLIAFLIWKFSFLGFAFDYIESEFFGRSFMNINASFSNWAYAFRSMLLMESPQHSAYYFTEFLGMFVGIITIWRSQKYFPELAWFSLAVFLVSLGSGPAQGIHRYILGTPAVFITLARWGENPVFDRVWTIISALLMGMLAMLFAFNMWVA
ncbi:MAG: mannosyltransferase family protein [Chloroflexi bacterium]|nr:mannosyltransferase family protein [Chloroflexota bacterium]